MGYYWVFSAWSLVILVNLVLFKLTYNLLKIKDKKYISNL